MPSAGSMPPSSEKALDFRSVMQTSWYPRKVTGDHVRLMSLIVTVVTTLCKSKLMNKHVSVVCRICPALSYLWDKCNISYRKKQWSDTLLRPQGNIKFEPPLIKRQSQICVACSVTLALKKNPIQTTKPKAKPQTSGFCTKTRALTTQPFPRRTPQVQQSPEKKQLFTRTEKPFQKPSEKGVPCRAVRGAGNSTGSWQVLSLAFYQEIAASFLITSCLGNSFKLLGLNQKNN